MKKKNLIYAVTLLSTCLLIGSGILLFGNNSIDPLMEENILALSETEPGETVFCYNTITTADGKMVMYCQTCTMIPGTNVLFSGTGHCLPMASGTIQ